MVPQVILDQWIKKARESQINNKPVEFDLEIESNYGGVPTLSWQQCLVIYLEGNR